MANSLRVPRCRSSAVLSGTHYAFLHRLTIRDADAMRKYVNEAPATVAAYGGRYHFRGSDVQALEGSWDQDRMVLLEFPSKADALAWYESDILPSVALTKTGKRRGHDFTRGWRCYCSVITGLSRLK